MAKRIYTDLFETFAGRFTCGGGFQNLRSDMCADTGIAPRNTLADLLEDSTQKRSGSGVQQLEIPPMRQEIADSGDCGQGFRLNATMHSDRRRPPVPTKAAGVSLPA
ncbi:hypothetical protein ACVWWI_006635 [Bradyrhizobium sp. USDA 3686]|nr:hypothetical protein [Bradyrhizobium canariense]